MLKAFVLKSLRHVHKTKLANFKPNGSQAIPHILVDTPKHWQTVLVFRVTGQQSKRLNTKTMWLACSMNQKEKKGRDKENEKIIKRKYSNIISQIKSGLYNLKNVNALKERSSRKDLIAKTSCNKANAFFAIS